MLPHILVKSVSLEFQTIHPEIGCSEVAIRYLSSSERTRFKYQLKGNHSPCIPLDQIPNWPVFAVSLLGWHEFFFYLQEVQEVQGICDERLIQVDALVCQIITSDVSCYLGSALEVHSVLPSLTSCSSSSPLGSQVILIILRRLHTSAFSDHEIMIDEDYLLLIIGVLILSSP